MAQANPLIASFSSGEVSPLMQGRVDFARYFTGLEVLKNFYVMAQGPAKKRSGTLYAGDVHLDKKAILHPFIFSETESYLLIFSNNWLQVLDAEGAQVAALATTYTEAQLGGMDFEQSADTLWIVHKSHRPRILVRSGGTWTLSDEVFVDGPYLDENTTPNTIHLSSIVDTATITSEDPEFAAGDVGDWVQYCEDGIEKVALIHTFTDANTVQVTPTDRIVDINTIDPRAKLEYEAGTSGPFTARIRSQVQIWGRETENSYINIGGFWYLTGEHFPYFETVTPAAPGAAYSADVIDVVSTLTIKTTFGVITFSDRTITAAVHFSEATLDAARDVGRHFRLDLAGQKVWGKLLTVSSSTDGTAELGRMVPLDPNNHEHFINGNAAGTSTPKFQLGAWYVGNYPSVIDFHDGRLVFANTPLEPQTMWFSAAGDYTNMAPTENDSTVQDDNAINITLDSGTINGILWAISSQVLLVGTEGGVWQIKPDNLNQPLTPTNITARRHIPSPCQALRPAAIGQSVLFIQRGGTILQEALYSFDIDGWRANDITTVSEHILRDHGGVIDLAYQAEPNPRIWLACGNGDVICVTYAPSEGVEVVAYSVMDFSGTVEAIEVIPTASGKDRLFLSVLRGTQRLVEYLEADWYVSEGQEMVFADCAKIASPGSPTNTVIGFDHLNGSTVSVLADGSKRPPVTVSGGEVTFEGPAATSVVAGIPFTSELLTLPLEGGVQGGTAQGRMKRYTGLAVRLLESIEIKHGPELGNVRLHEFWETSHIMGDPPQLFTGDLRVDIVGDNERQARIALAHDSPYPLTILALMPEGQVGKR